MYEMQRDPASREEAAALATSFLVGQFWGHYRRQTDAWKILPLQKRALSLN